MPGGEVKKFLFLILKVKITFIKENTNINTPAIWYDFKLIYTPNNIGTIKLIISVITVEYPIYFALSLLLTFSDSIILYGKSVVAVEIPYNIPINQT